MRFLNVENRGRRGIAAVVDGMRRGLFEGDPSAPGTLDDLVAAGREGLERAHELLGAAPILPEGTRLRPVLERPGKIVCVGLNYRDHSAEVAFEQPDYPTLFTRFASTLVGDGAPLIIPTGSAQFDYEGEIAAIIGTGGRRIARERALDHVLGWSLFNDASVRDYQFRTPQWTMGKNFDGTGAFGPELVTADELAANLAGVVLETRLNDELVQSASVADMVFDVAMLIATISEAMTLDPGDVIVTGTPAGVGMGRKPPLWLRPGDTVAVSATGLGVLSNPVAAEDGR